MYFGSKVIHRPHHVFVYTYTRNVCGLSFHLCMAAMVTDTLHGLLWKSGFVCIDPFEIIHFYNTWEYENSNYT